MSLLNEDINKQLKELFVKMGNDVTLAVFTAKEGCDSCPDTVDYMNEISELSEKINVVEYDINEDSEKANELNVEMTPAIVILDHNLKDNGVKYYGIPAGHEINSMITGIMEVSGTGEEIPAEFAERIAKIDKDIDIKVFITLSCPHCPGAVSKAHKLALMNEKINGVMIEAQTFGELSQKFDVQGVPKIVINDEFELVGNQPLDKFLEEIEKVK